MTTTRHPYAMTADAAASLLERGAMTGLQGAATLECLEDAAREDGRSTGAWDGLQGSPSESPDHDRAPLGAWASTAAEAVRTVAEDTADRHGLPREAVRVLLERWAATYADEVRATVGDAYAAGYADGYAHPED